MKLIRHSDDVKSLSDEQFLLLEKIYAHYRDVMIEHVVLFETIHGHIVQLNKQGGRFLPHTKGLAGRFDHEDMAVLEDPGIRWVELATDTLKVGI